MDGCRECGVVGSHLFDCPDRIAEMEKGILECQTRILALERELAEAKVQHNLLRQAVSACMDCLPECDSNGHAEQCPYTNVAIWLEKLAQDRDEAHAAIRAFRNALHQIREWAGSHTVPKPDFGPAGFTAIYSLADAVLVTHAPVIRRAMGEGK